MRWLGPTSFSGSDSIEKRKTDEASMALIAVMARLPEDRQVVISKEVARRKAAFDVAHRTAAAEYIGCPERRALEGVYADVVAGRL